MSETMSHHDRQKVMEFEFVATAENAVVVNGQVGWISGVYSRIYE